ncbi:MAG: hypothetical protein RIS44_2202 [Pseudomonadota bacterium]|jgi:hypothetical protein
MSSSPDVATDSQTAPDGHVTLVLEAGVPFQMGVNSDTVVDPIAEWLSLMEVVQRLCPVWPVRQKGMQGNCWRL